MRVRPRLGLRLAVDVTSESLGEATILGISLLRRDEWVDPIALGTSLEIQRDHNS
jgi:hypothetical protein